MTPEPSELKRLEISLYDDQLISARFSFISDPILRQNIILYAKYMLMLHSLSREYSVPAEQKYINNKMTIILASQIAEGILHFIVKEGISTQKLQTNCLGTKEITLPGNKTIKLGVPLKDILPPLQLPNDVRISVKVEQTVNIEFSDNISFNDLIQALQREGVYLDLVTACQSLQKKRNRIHLGGLTVVDDVYDDMDVDKAFEELNLVIEEASKIVT